jgi:hypothetical protein
MSNPKHHDDTGSGARKASSVWKRLNEGYDPAGSQPTGSYLLVLSAYGGLAGILLLIGRKLNGNKSVRIPVGDLVLIALATQRLSRLVAKDPLTSPLRMPFTKYVGVSGESELAEEVRGEGIQRVVGELLSCPFCVGQWIATVFTFGMVVAPGLTRIVTGVFAGRAAADFLQLAYAAAQERFEQQSS